MGCDNMIATIDEVKSILGMDLGNTSQDSRIKIIASIVEPEIHDICKNHFIRDIDIENSKYVGLNTISFSESDSKINDSSNSLGCFIAGNSIKVISSLENDGIYLISSVDSSGAFIVIDTDYGELVDEDAGEYIGIYKLWYPRGLKFAFAAMINYHLSKDKNKINKGIESEKVDDYSVKFGAVSSSKYGYPASIINMLMAYRKYY
jgi:hypothetical protein